MDSDKSANYVKRGRNCKRILAGLSFKMLMGVLYNSRKSGNKKYTAQVRDKSLSFGFRLSIEEDNNG